MDANHLGGSYLKTGQLKPNRDGSARRLECEVSGRNGSARIVPARETDRGKFGPALEIPISIEGQDFVISLPADKGDGKLLQAVFGPLENGAWTGRRIVVYESDVLDRIRVEPVA